VKDSSRLLLTTGAAVVAALLGMAMLLLFLSRRWLLVPINELRWAVNAVAAGRHDTTIPAVGPRELDLGWHFGLEFMMERLFGSRVAGFPEKGEAIARYEIRSGHTVTDLDWHEVFALVRALAINDRHQRITGDTRRRDNPMGEVLRARLETAG